MPTQPAENFLFENERIKSLLEIATVNAHRIVDDDQFRHDTLLLLFVGDQIKREEAQGRVKDRLQVGFNGHFSLFAELIACRLVDSFETYLFELFFLIFKKEPALLLVNEVQSNKQSIELNLLVSYYKRDKSIGDILAMFAEKKAGNLAYKSISEKNKILKDKYKLMFPPASRH